LTAQAADASAKKPQIVRPSSVQRANSQSVSIDWSYSQSVSESVLVCVFCDDDIIIIIIIITRHLIDSTAISSNSNSLLFVPCSFLLQEYTPAIMILHRSFHLSRTRVILLSSRAIPSTTTTAYPGRIALYHHMASAAGNVSIFQNQQQQANSKWIQKQLVRSVFIQTENTPNPESIKFVPTNTVRKITNNYK
jgi:hypothetical protein